ncbi:MAG: hypothetical protein D6730_11055 [Bacteroidetes bacterium]|nr:MAG: hypothetical protein D6730_11055 [Bacteroidota bacterium]
MLKKLRTLNLIGILLILLGLLIASEPFPIPRALPLGMLITGIGIIIAHLNPLITGLAIFTSSFREEKQIFRVSSSSFQGLTARIWGAEMVLLGCGIAYLAFREWLAPGWVLAWVHSPSGLAQLLLGVGLLVAITGLLALLGPAESRESKKAFLLSLPSRLLGLCVLIAGTALLVLGVIQLLHPGAIGTWIKEMRPSLPMPLFISS